MNAPWTPPRSHDDRRPIGPRAAYFFGEAKLYASQSLREFHDVTLSPAQNDARARMRRDAMLCLALARRAIT